MPSSRPRSSDRLARCCAAGSLTEALSAAVKIVCLEFRLQGDREPPKGSDCVGLRAWWDGEKASLLSLVSGVRKKARLLSTLSSCSRLFDDPCKSCDKKIATMARNDWYCVTGTCRSGHVGLPTQWSDDPIGELAAKVRELVGINWAKKISRGEAIPDQQGCLENKRMTGGTFGVGFEEGLLSPANHVRVGVAKTKGKFRVVTMQSARVKRILTPVHDALYDHLSSFGWLVRGELKKSHLLPVVDDKRKGEVYVSGDYKSATDNIHLPAVLAIVDVLCESVDLTDDEKDVLRSSFTDLKRISNSGIAYPILQGSMMGNLVSFPILCLLNKACYDLARDKFEATRGERSRLVRINGDDLVFCGTHAFFLFWKSVVAHYGLVINDVKTGLSGRFLELNSRKYDTKAYRFVGKPVLSFLRRSSKPGNLLSEVVKGLRTFSHRVFWYVVNDLLRHEISLREISPADLPKWVLNGLVKKLWFRNAVLRGPCPVKTKGVNRCYPTTIGPVPHPDVYARIDAAEVILRKRFVEKWLGRKVPPREEFVDRRQMRLKIAAHRGVVSPWYLGVSKPSWAFLWPKRLLTFVRNRHPLALLDCVEDEWIDEHPRLTTSVSFEIRGKKLNLPFSPPALLLSGVNLDGFIQWPNGPV